MSGPLSVIYDVIYIIKTEEGIVKPTNSKFNKRFVDEIISKKKKRKKKDQPDLYYLRI